MKIKMKKLISIKSMPLFTLALLVFFGTALAASREPVSISGVVNLSTFAGTATVTIADEELVGIVQVIPVGGMVPKDGGLYFPVVEHWFMFPDADNPMDILITTGEEFIMPTDEDPTVSTLHGNMEIIPQSALPEGPSATGKFEGVSGELRVNGKFNSPPGKASFSANGAVFGYDGD